MIEVKNLAVAYGRNRAVADASLKIGRGELVALIGANGAGKTTLLHAIVGLLTSVAGTIKLDGTEINRMPSYLRVEKGIALVPEARRLFPGLTVRENLEIGFQRRLGGRFHRALFRERFESISSHFSRLRERETQLAGTLSGGEQQMVAIARALMSAPKFLLLDEPSLGLSPLMVERVADILTSLHQANLGILLVEQNAELALELADRAYVMETGRTILDGPAEELLDNVRVKEAYLGMAATRTRLA